MKIKGSDETVDLPTESDACLGTPVVSFSPFLFGGSLLKLNSRKKGTLIIQKLLGNLVAELSTLITRTACSSDGSRGGSSRSINKKGQQCLELQQ